MFEGDWQTALEVLKWLVIVGFTFGVVFAVFAAGIKLGLKLWWLVFIAAALVWLF